MLPTPRTTYQKLSTILSVPIVSAIRYTRVKGNVPCTIEDEEPHRRAQRRGKESVLEARKMRVEPGA